MGITVYVFDAYGTLFDVSAAAHELAEADQSTDFALVREKVATDWRLRQLQYSWIRAILDQHADFWTVTKESLDWALQRHGLAGRPDLRRRLLDLYLELSAFAEVPAMLGTLKAKGRRTAILSNGSTPMLDSAVKAAGIAGLLDSILSVEQVGVFKPHRSVYDLVTQEFRCDAAEVLFASSNGWDAAAAACYGFKTVWVNRQKEPVECLPWKPDFVLDDLEKIPQVGASL